MSPYRESAAPARPRIDRPQRPWTARTWCRLFGHAWWGLFCAEPHELAAGGDPLRPLSCGRESLAFCTRCGAVELAGHTEAEFWEAFERWRRWVDDRDPP